MKILLKMMYLIAALSLSCTTAASDLQTLYPDKLKEAKNLYNLAYDFFKGPDSLPPGEVFTPEMLKDRKRQEAYYKLWRLTTLAIDAGYDMSDLEAFGLVHKPKQGGYFIDLRKTPQWADMYRLFYSIGSIEQLNGTKYYLNRKGFSDFDYKVLEDYVTKNNPRLQIEHKRRAIVQAQMKLQGDGNVTNTKQTIAFHEADKRIRFDAWTEWAIKLLNQYPMQKQRILIDYLQEKMGYVGIAKSPISIKRLEAIKLEIQSGQALARVNKSIDTMTAKQFKEVKQ